MTLEGRRKPDIPGCPLCPSCKGLARSPELGFAGAEQVNVYHIFRLDKTSYSLFPARPFALEYEMSYSSTAAHFYRHLSACCLKKMTTCPISRQNKTGGTFDDPER